MHTSQSEDPFALYWDCWTHYPPGRIYCNTYRGSVGDEDETRRPSRMCANYDRRSAVRSALSGPSCSFYNQEKPSNDNPDPTVKEPAALRMRNRCAFRTPRWPPIKRDEDNFQNTPAYVVLPTPKVIVRADVFSGLAAT